MTNAVKKIHELAEKAKERPREQGQVELNLGIERKKPKFLPVAYDIAAKDDFNIMDVAPFRLSKRHTRKAGTIEYEVGHAVVQIKGGADGMATVYDYDIVLMMISHLAEQARMWKQGKANKPSTRFAPTVAEILRFCQREKKGSAYQQIEAALNRLQTTSVNITVEDDNWRRKGAFSLIDGYTVLTKTKSGKLNHVAIGIPNWIYDGVVDHEKPTVLTINPNYFQIDSGLARFLYRLARKAAGANTFRYTLRELFKRSGSQGDFRKFRYNVKELVNNNIVPDYDFSLENDVLMISHREGDL